MEKMGEILTATSRPRVTDRNALHERIDRVRTAVSVKVVLTRGWERIESRTTKALGGRRKRGKSYPSVRSRLSVTRGRELRRSESRWGGGCKRT